MNLIIEVGNTNVKLGVFKGEDLVYCYTAPAMNYMIPADLAQFTIQNGMISGSGHLSRILDLAWPIDLTVFDRSMISDLASSYGSPLTLGSDRLLSGYMATQRYLDVACLIIDCGTCMTSTLVADQRIIDGSISPGLNLRLQVMHEHTAKLPALQLDVDIHLSQYEHGLDTESSMLNGAIFGIIYEIEARIDKAKEQFSELKVVLTGGHAQFLSNKIKSEIFVDSHWTMRGMNLLLMSH